ncbi:MAG TPA: hydrogenase maturation protease [Pseudonocardiaceae bacterium]|jgi:hydrogenase maturation protease|nr:hydrogenase maturation protease [Pseudonocardiaceae bacterium]
MTGAVTTMVAGIGNIFLSDDAFGVELARRLSTETLPEGVRVVDYGIRGMHLAYDLLEMAPATTILLDAVSRGGEPGTIYVLEIGHGDVPGIEPSAVDAHGMTPDAVLALLENLGGNAGRTLLVGCEPVSTEDGIGLSETVAAAVDRAVSVVMDLLTDKEGSEGNVPSTASADLLGVSSRPGHRSGTGV